MIAIKVINKKLSGLVLALLSQHDDFDKAKDEVIRLRKTEENRDLIFEISKNEHDFPIYYPKLGSRLQLKLRLQHLQ